MARVSVKTLLSDARSIRNVMLMNPKQVAETIDKLVTEVEDCHRLINRYPKVKADLAETRRRRK